MSTIGTASPIMLAATATNAGLMKASYQQPIDVAAQLREKAVLSASAHPSAGLMGASPALMMAAYSPRPITGLTFIPPLNANPTIVSPPLPRSRLMAAAVQQLPEYFNWADAQHANAVKGWPAATHAYVPGVPNQYSCGSCWAWSSSTVLASRTAIWTQQPVVPASTTFTLACVGDTTMGSDPLVHFANTAGCNGGFPAAAAELFARQGTATFHCSDYSWCTGDAQCTGQSQVVGGGGGDLNALIPHCGVQNSDCTDHVRSKPYADDRATSHSLTNIYDIQTEIFANGPVVAAYVVKQDFYLAMPWSQTNGVYVNTPSKPAYPNADPNSVQGFHAVAVVGWGIERGVKNWMSDNPESRIDIPYWIIQNSWGVQWNAQNYVNDNKLHLPGFWKHAMRINVNGVWLNDNIGIDHMATVDNYTHIGGCTTFDPNVKRVYPSRKGPSKKGLSKQKTTAKRQGDPSDSPPRVIAKNEATWLIALAFTVVVLLLLILGTYSARVTASSRAV